MQGTQVVKGRRFAIRMEENKQTEENDLDETQSWSTKMLQKQIRGTNSGHGSLAQYRMRHISPVADSMEVNKN